MMRVGDVLVPDHSIDTVPSGPHSPHDSGDLDETARPHISRRRLFLLAAGAVAGTAAGFKLLAGFGGFRINQVEASTPAFDPATFRLTVDGDVENPLTLSWDDLLALPKAAQVSDFHCVEGWGVDNVRWEGVRLQTIMELAKPRNAPFITFHSLDGEYSDSLTMAEAAFPDVLLAYHMYEQPMSARHGRPLRLIVPHMYGYKGPKWLTRIEFAHEQVIGYWEQRGWQLDAWIT
ncbi:MAG: molybdopterin-dependent oxidoreductase [Dehalococcoidia bacterium]